MDISNIRSIRILENGKEVFQMFLNTEECAPKKIVLELKCMECGDPTEHQLCSYCLNSTNPMNNPVKPKYLLAQMKKKENADYLAMLESVKLIDPHPPGFIDKMLAKQLINKIAFEPEEVEIEKNKFMREELEKLYGTMFSIDITTNLMKHHSDEDIETLFNKYLKPKPEIDNVFDKFYVEKIADKTVRDIIFYS